MTALPITRRETDAIAAAPGTGAGSGLRRYRRHILGDGGHVGRLPYQEAAKTRRRDGTPEPILVSMSRPISADESLLAQRRLDYAEGIAVLDEDHDVPGAAAIFEQALRNGLAVIAARWPNSDLNSKGKVKSAKNLLEVIVAEEARSGQIDRVLVLNEPTSRVVSTRSADPSLGGRT